MVRLIFAVPAVLPEKCSIFLRYLFPPALCCLRSAELDQDLLAVAGIQLATLYGLDIGNKVVPRFTP